MDINKRFKVTGGWIAKRQDLYSANPMLIKLLKQNLVAPYFQESTMGIAREYSEIQHFFEQHGHSISVGFYGEDDVRSVLESKCNLSHIQYWVPTGDFQHTPTTLNWHVFDYLSKHNLTGVVAINQTWLAVEYYEEFLHDLARFKISVVDPINVEYK